MNRLLKMRKSIENRRSNRNDVPVFLASSLVVILILMKNCRDKNGWIAWRRRNTFVSEKYSAILYGSILKKSVLLGKPTADHGNRSQGEDYEESEEDDYDNDDDEDDHISERKPFPFFTPVTPYPPVYCTYVFQWYQFWLHSIFSCLNHIDSIVDLILNPISFKISWTVLRSKTIVEADPVLREAETESDCQTDRAAALDEQKVCAVRLHCIEVIALKVLIDWLVALFNPNRMVHRRGMFPSVRLMGAINASNAIVPSAIAGVFMRTLAKTYRAHR